MEEKGSLFIIATPIGNLADMTFRAVEILKKADTIVCEDTRTTKRLLDHYGIETEAISFYRKSSGRGAMKPVPRVAEIIAGISRGKDAAFVSDAGTPGISDPGNRLVEAAAAEGIAVIPIPGASSLTALASVSGIDLQKFVFLGFPPHKKGRETFFKEIAGLEYPVIYLESPHRLIRNLELLKSLAPEKRIIMGRELTKLFEEIIRGEVGTVLDYFSANPDKIKGEMTVIAY